MLSGGMLVSSLMLLPFLLVLVSFCLFPLVFVAWLCLLSWAPCPPGVLATMQDEHPAFFEDMRERSGSHGYLAPEPSSSSCLNAGPRLSWLPALFSFLVFRSSFFVFAPLGAALYGLRLYSAICFL